MTAASSPRIALVHALEESVLPARAAFRELWPEATLFDLLDTSLSADLAARGSLDQTIVERFMTLGRYAAGTQGIGGTTRAMLFTCSAFGPAIDAVKRDLRLPVLRPNEAAFSEALAAHRRIGLLVTFAPSLPALTQELRAEAAERNLDIAVTGAVVEGALAALKADDGALHDELAAQAAKRLKDVDVIVLGQFSLARARSAVAAATGLPVITTPHSAVRALRRAIEGSA